MTLPAHVRSSGRPVVRSSLIALLLCASLSAGEPLVCRGFDAASAVNAVISTGGQLLVIDPDLRQRQVWFALADAEPTTARQALAHALGCWFTATGSAQLTRQPRLAGAATVVRAFPSLPSTPPGCEALLRRLLDPWLGGNGGLALDTLSGGWTITASPSGAARLELLLSALGNPTPRAPHLLSPGQPSDRTLERSPRGADLASWCLDLAALSGLSVALSPDCDPAAPAPSRTIASLDQAAAALAERQLTIAQHHRCLCIGAAEPIDRQHPAERAVVAVMPVDHLCRDDAQLALLTAQLGARVAPGAWDLPGWGLAALPWRSSVLIVADPPAIHAVMTALEAADAIGLEAWLR